MSLLRQANAADLEKLLPMVAAYHAFEGITLTDEVRREVVQRLLSDDSLGAILVFGPSQSPVGYLALTFGYSIELGGRDAFIDEFFIRERVRGKGMGSQVMSALPQIMQEFGVMALHLEVARSNEAAQRIYLKAGFQPRDKYFLMTRSV